MANGATTGMVSGAAQGAATGSMILPGWGTAIGAVVGGIGGFISGSSADAQHSNANAWAQYNAGMQYNTDMYNINSGLQIAQLNAAAQMGAANMQAAAIKQAADYNSAITFATVSYNHLLQNQELDRLWEDEGLALEQLAAARARERGEIESRQSASGTVMGQDSNADVIISQQTQEAMDANIIMHNADRQAANIMNQMAQGVWQGQVAISQTMWEGEMQSYVTKANAAIGAGAMMAGANIQANADRWTAGVRRDAAANNIRTGNSQYAAQNTQNMISGLFQAGATYAGGKIARKAPNMSKAYTTSGGAPGGALIPSGTPTLLSRNAPAYSGAGSSLAVTR